jgi:dTDP-4-amino-4,6-dideoxygalactose transaminase
MAECPGMKFRAVGDDVGNAGIALFMDLETPTYAEKFSKALAAEGIRIGPSSGCENLLHSEIVQSRQQVHPALPPFGPGCPGQHVRYSPDQCPRTDDIFNSQVAVAIVPGYTQDDVNDIITAIIKVWRHQAD